VIACSSFSPSVITAAPLVAGLHFDSVRVGVDEISRRDHPCALWPPHRQLDLQETSESKRTAVGPELTALSKQGLPHPQLLG
jgi:hypothetical protein